jgi:hypothetical protein
MRKFKEMMGLGGDGSSGGVATKDAARGPNKDGIGANSKTRVALDRILGMPKSMRYETDYQYFEVSKYEAALRVFRQHKPATLALVRLGTGANGNGGRAKEVILFVRSASLYDLQAGDYKTVAKTSRRVDGTSNSIEYRELVDQMIKAKMADERATSSTLGETTRPRQSARR